MSIASCLAGLLRSGKITKQQHDDAKSIYDGVMNDDLLRNMDQATAEAHATLRTAKILEDAAKAKKLELARKTTIYNANLERLKAHPDGPLAGFMALYDRDIRNAAGDRINVSSLETEHYRPMIAQKMHAFDEAYRSTMAGLKQDVTGIRNMVRELFGVDTGDQVAKAAARGWKGATDYATGQARNLGRVFDTDNDWRLPQFWESARVNKFGADEFKADLDKHISTGGLKVFDTETGKIVGGADRERIVKTAIDDIRKDLSSKVGPSTVFKQEQRTFRFSEGEAGAKAYLDLMDKYGPGQGHYYGMMQGHAQSMARELSLLHVMGPGFRGTGEQLLKDAVEADATRALEPVDKAPLEKVGDVLLKGIGLEGRIAAKRLHQYMTGQLSGAESDTVAGIFSGARAFLTATNMGSAIVSALPADSVNWAMAANFRGMNAGRLAQNIVDQLFQKGADQEALATRLGITAHAVSRAALGTKQYGDQLIGSGVFQRMADTVIRAQGLHAWDTAISRSFTMEMLASIGDRAGKSFDEIDPEFRSFLTDYGFTPEDWAKLSTGGTFEVGAAKWLMPDSLEGELRAKLMSAIGDEKQFAYIAGGSNRVRALATGGVKAGTVIGEAARSFFLFKTFPMTMLSTWGMRGAQEAGQGRWATAAQLVMFMTFAGALAIQAKQVLQGKDPMNMKDGFFWGEAFAQGGALGIYGDFLKDGFSRSGTSLTEAALGPLAEIPASVQRLTSGARRAAESGENVNFGSALADDIQRFTPGSSLWYARLLANRYLFDNIRRAVDPQYTRSFERAKQNAEKLHGQQFWWAPGESAPDHAPNLGAALQ